MNNLQCDDSCWSTPDKFSCRLTRCNRIVSWRSSSVILIEWTIEFCLNDCMKTYSWERLWSELYWPQSHCVYYQKVSWESSFHAITRSELYMYLCLHFHLSEMCVYYQFIKFSNKCRIRKKILSWGGGSFRTITRSEMARGTIYSRTPMGASACFLNWIVHFKILPIIEIR